MRKAENTVIKCLKSQFLSATSELFDLGKLFYLSISSAIEQRENKTYFTGYED